MRIVLILIGTVSLALGLLGLLLPLLPTTPFLLLSAGCFSRASTRLHGWLMRLPVAGRMLDDYSKRGGVSVGTKFLALTMLWAGIAFSALAVGGPHRSALQALLAVIGLVVSVVIARLPTLDAGSERLGS